MKKAIDRLGTVLLGTSFTLAAFYVKRNYYFLSGKLPFGKHTLFVFFGLYILIMLSCILRFIKGGAIFPNKSIDELLNKLLSLLLLVMLSAGFGVVVACFGMAIGSLIKK